MAGSTAKPVAGVAITEATPLPSKTITTQYIKQDGVAGGGEEVMDQVSVEEQEQPKPHTQTVQGGDYPPTQKPGPSSGNSSSSMQSQIIDTAVEAPSNGTKELVKQVHQNVTDEPQGFVHVPLLPFNSSISIVKYQIAAAQKALEQAKAGRDNSESQTTPKVVEQVNQDQSESKLLSGKSDNPEQSVLPKDGDAETGQVEEGGEGAVVPNHQLLQYVSTQMPAGEGAGPDSAQEEHPPVTASAVAENLTQEGSNKADKAKDVLPATNLENQGQDAETVHPPVVVPVVTETPGGKDKNSVSTTTLSPGSVHQASDNGEDEYFLKPKVNLKGKLVSFS